VSPTQVCRIVVVGPSDVESHVTVIRRVADELNHLFQRRGVSLHVVDWREDAHPGPHEHGGQGKIESDLRINDSDILIGIFWRIFGTSMKGGDSATAAELRYGYESWKAKKTPRVMVYFDQRSQKSTTTWELDQERKILEFKEELKNKLFYIADFEGVLEFERKVRSDLMDYVLDRVSEKASSEIKTTDLLFCWASASPYSIRVEGLTELAGELTLGFYGSQVELKRRLMEKLTISLLLNTSITNRLYRGDLTDCLLVGNHGASEEFCILGRLTASNALEFTITPNANLLETTFRIINLRINANVLGLVRHPRIMVHGLIIAGDISVLNPRQILAYIVRGITCQLLRDGKEIEGDSTNTLKAIAHSYEASPNVPTFRQATAATNVPLATIRFSEVSPNTFRPRTADSRTLAGLRITHAGETFTVPPSESGHQQVMCGDGSDGPFVSGQADCGTRLVAEFRGVNYGVRVAVSRVQRRSTSGLAAVFVNSETGPIEPSTATSVSSSEDSVEVTIDGPQFDRRGKAVWEIIDRSRLEPGEIEFDVFISYESRPEVNLPHLGTAAVILNIAPHSTATTATGTDPVPRFVDIAPRRSLFSITK
jgi:hypothetical protein